MNKFTAPNTYFVIVVAAISGSLGAGVMLFDARSTTESVNFITSNGFITWFFLNIVAFALYPVLFVPLWRSVVKYRRYFRKEIIIAAAVIIVLISLPDTLARIYIPAFTKIPLAYAAPKIAVIIGVGVFSVALPAATVIWFIQIALREDFNEVKYSNAHIEKYMRLRDDLSLMILILGSFNALLALAAAALRQVSIASNAITVEDYPLLYVSIYGSYFTFLLVIVYLPVYLSLNAVGNKICNSIFNLPPADSSSWSDIYSRRKNLQELMGLSSTDIQSWQSGLAVLAPFIGGVISTLLEK